MEKTVTVTTWLNRRRRTTGPISVYIQASLVSSDVKPSEFSLWSTAEYGCHGLQVILHLIPWIDLISTVCAAYRQVTIRCRYPLDHHRWSHPHLHASSPPVSVAIAPPPGSPSQLGLGMLYWSVVFARLLLLNVNSQVLFIQYVSHIRSDLTSSLF